ncbi:hypothetical protein L1887_43396 [Cichorium endivia]|nr:hypothetical protein L1887_43396 [Cichorium endivia]
MEAQLKVEERWGHRADRGLFGADFTTLQPHHGRVVPSFTCGARPHMAVNPHSPPLSQPCSPRLPPSPSLALLSLSGAMTTLAFWPTLTAGIANDPAQYAKYCSAGSPRAEPGIRLLPLGTQ